MEHEVARLAELSDSAATLKRVGEKSVVLVRIAGEVFAVDPVCPHWKGPIVQGKVSATRLEIECPWHRFRFDLRTGACVASNLRPPLPVYPVRVEGERVLVTLPDQSGH